ncbi:MAG TPA: methyltransferase domain-containing protein [Xanthomonadales bacterium]|nr:methyltransferase domain-containing protein [Xanthomonadales bacterium]
MTAAPAVAADTYLRWRTTTLGAITEDLETRLIFDLAGSLAGQRVLDIGTGDGQYAIHAALRGAQVTAVDSSQEMLEAARQRADEQGVHLVLQLGNVSKLPFRDDAFDVVLAVTVLCLVPDAELAVREMARVLRPGGRLLLGDLGPYNFWAAGRRLRAWLGAPFWRNAHFRSQRQLRGMVSKAGLTVVATRGTVHYPPIALAARLLLPIEPLLTRMRMPGAAFLALAASKPGLP